MLLIMSCKNSEKDTSVSYNDAVVNVKILSSNWYTTTLKNNDKLYFGSIHLKAGGTTNANSIFIETRGDGSCSFVPLDLDTNKEFNFDLVITFSPFPYNPLGVETTEWALMRAMKGLDTLEFKLNSGKLVY